MPKTKVPAKSLAEIQASKAKLYKEMLDSDMKRVEQVYQIAPVLQDAGFPVDFYDWDSMESISLGVTNDASDLTRLRHICGKLETVYTEPESDDGRNRNVLVTLRPVDYPCVRIVFRKKWPKQKSVKCRWVTKRTKQRVLVCE